MKSNTADGFPHLCPHCRLVSSLETINIRNTGNHQCLGGFGYLYFQYRFFVSWEPADNAREYDGTRLLSEVHRQWVYEPHH